MNVYPKLAWLPGLQNTLAGATGDVITYTVEDHVDPLKKLVTLHLGTELGPGDWNPFQTICHSYAKSNDCVIEKIYRQPKKLILHVLIKRRGGPATKHNPMG